MGQVFAPSTGGINVATTDREAGPGAGSGANGNRDIFLGASAGLNSTVSDSIMLGNLAGSGGITTLNGMDKTIVIGSGSLKAANVSATSSTGMVVVGSNVAPTLQGAIGDSVFIGNNILQNISSAALVSNARNTFVGNNICQGTIFSTLNAQGLANNTIVGYGSGWTQTGNSNSPMTSCIWIGVNTGINSSTSGFVQCIGIGNGAGPSGVSVTGTAQLNIYIGDTAISTTQVNSAGNHVIGHNSTSQGLNNQLYGNSIIRGGDTNIIIGNNAGSTQTIPAGNGAVFIGNDNVGAMLYGVMSSGNLLVGNSVTADRQFRGTPGTNCLKLINGTVGSGANTVNGGYFYVSAGALHYVGSAGTDTTLAPA